jgi:hypothetical protein
MKFSTKLTAVAVALTGAVGGAQATQLLFNTPTTGVDSAYTFFTGTQVDSATTLINNASFNGTATTAVYKTAAGTLDFYYQFSNNASSANGVERFTGWDFTALGSGSVEVYQTDTASANGLFHAGTENSDYADRTSLGVIGFNFVPNSQSKINPGQTSFTQVIHTNATSYVAGNFGLLDGIGDNAAGFAVAAVPEPETYAMMLAGLGLMATIARRRKAKKS